MQTDKITIQKLAKASLDLHMNEAQVLHSFTQSLKKHVTVAPKRIQRTSSLHHPLVLIVFHKVVFFETANTKRSIVPVLEQQ